MGLVLSRIILISMNFDIRNYLILIDIILIFFLLNAFSIQELGRIWFKVRQKHPGETHSDANGPHHYQDPRPGGE
jgi:hypothetical protein